MANAKGRGGMVLRVDPKSQWLVEQAGLRFGEVLARAVAEIMARQRRRVEIRILEGENRVEVPYLPYIQDSRRLIYTVPSWRRHLVKRLRVEWHRWCWRRSREKPLVGCEREVQRRD